MRPGEDVGLSALPNSVSSIPTQTPSVEPRPTEIAWLRVNEGRDPDVSLLDETENYRAGNFVRAADRTRFVLGVVLSKALISRQAGVGIETIRLDRICRECRRPHGRPRLIHPDIDLDFSVTHSGRLVAVAICATGQVGIDAEHLDRNAPSERNMRKVLAKAEHGALSGMSGPERGEAFLRIWTRKEAVIKLMGTGLGVDMSEVVVSRPEEPPSLIAFPHHRDLQERLRMYDVVPEIDRHIMSLAVLHPEAGGFYVFSGADMLNRLDRG